MREKFSRFHVTSPTDRQPVSDLNFLRFYDLLCSLSSSLLLAFFLQFPLSFILVTIIGSIPGESSSPSRQSRTTTNCTEVSCSCGRSSAVSMSLPQPTDSQSQSSASSGSCFLTKVSAFALSSVCFEAACGAPTTFYTSCRYISKVIMPLGNSAAAFLSGGRPQPSTALPPLVSHCLAAANLAM